MLKLHLASGTVEVNPEDMINPLKNPLWTGTSVCTKNELLNVIKTIYTKENVEAHPEVFFAPLFERENAWREHDRLAASGMFSQEFVDLPRPNPRAAINHLLRGLPEDQYWKLFFVRHGSFYIERQIFKGMLMRFESTRDGTYVVFSASAGLILSNDENNNELSPLVAVANWSPTIFFNMDAIILTFAFDELNVNSEFFSRVVSIMCNQQVFNPVNDQGDRISGRCLRTSQILEHLDPNDPNNTTVGSLSMVCFPIPFFNPMICIRKAERPFDKTELYQVFSYRTSPLAHIRYPIKDVSDKNPKATLFGVELECSTDYPVSNIIDATATPFLLCKQDSSINGNKRFRYEMVTVPMTFRAHKRYWAEFFSNLDYTKFDTTLNTNNGMHVHVSRDAFVDQTHIKNIGYMFANPEHRGFWLSVSERTESSLNNFSPLPYWDRSQSAVKNYKHVLQACAATRGALNTGNVATIEFRLFRGAVSFAAVLKNLEVVESLLEFCLNRPFTELTLEHYLKWINKQPANRFAMYKAFIKEMDLDRIVYMTKLRITLDGYSRATALDALPTKEFPFTPELADALNEIFSCNNFAWSVAKNRIIYTGTPRVASRNAESVLAKYNKDVAARYTRNLKKSA
jgi:hypothetical protein